MYWVRPSKFILLTWLQLLPNGGPYFEHLDPLINKSNYYIIPIVKAFDSVNDTNLLNQEVPEGC